MTKPNRSRGLNRLPFWARLAVLPLLLAGVSAPAQNSNSVPANLDPAALQTLLNRLNNDEAQIRSLKAALDTRNGEAATAMPPAPTYPSLQFHGFGDVNYHVSSRIGENAASGVPYNPPATRAGNSFYTGELDLFLQSQLSEDFSILNETVIASGPNNDWGLDIERLMLSWKPSEYFNVDFGRFHTAMGYYNTAFHHGTWFQNATARPFFLEYEDSGGLVPVHSVGFSVHGAIPSGKWNLQYFAEVANGRDYTTNGNGPVQNVTDVNAAKSVNFAVIAKPDWFPGGQFGVGAYHDSVNPSGLTHVDEWIFNAHVVYHTALWELMAEGFLQRHHDGPTGTHYTPMFYVQAARKFGRFTPYARFTYANLSGSDPIYTAIIGQTGLKYGPTAGLRYDLSTFVALKLQYDYLMETGLRPASELTFQAAFTF